MIGILCLIGAVLFIAVLHLWRIVECLSGTVDWHRGLQSMQYETFMKEIKNLSDRIDSLESPIREEK